MSEQKSVLEKNINTFSQPKFVKEYTSDYLRSSEIEVINMIKPGGKILDLGCGAGRTTKYIKEKTDNVIGADLSEELINKAKELHPGVEFRVMNALKLDFPDQNFDLVFFSFNGLDNLYPLSQRKEALQEIKRVLKQGGIFAYSSHNSLSVPKTLYGFKIILKNFFNLRMGVHYRKEQYESGDLIQYYNNIWSERKILKNLGFKVEDILVNGKVNFIPWPFKFFLERFPLYVCKK